MRCESAGGFLFQNLKNLKNLKNLTCLYAYFVENLLKNEKYFYSPIVILKVLLYLQCHKTNEQIKFMNYGHKKNQLERTRNKD